MRTVAQYIWAALKAIGRFLVRVGSWILRQLSNLITWCRYNLSGRVQMIIIAVIVALIIVGVSLIFTGHGCAGPSESGESEMLAVEEKAPPVVSYSPQESDLQSFNVEPNTITSFSLVQSGNQMYAELSEADNAEITEALSYLESDKVNVGFLIVNLNTGSGYCYNIDTPIYGASTYKGPLSLFLCEQYIDTGQLKKSAVSTRIENAITWSDNTSYRSLKHAYEGTTQNNWLSSLGLDPKRFRATFPTYSVRDSATLWMHMWEYLNSGSDTAEWLGGLLKRTNLSLLRNGAEQAGMEDAVVYNKAGWCAASNDDEDAVNDAGIVVDGDNVYLVVAFTERSDSPTSEANLSNLFEALLNVRHDLDANNATWDNVEVVGSPVASEGEGESSEGSAEEIISGASSEQTQASSSDSSGNAGMAQRSGTSQIIVQSARGGQLLISEARR